LNQKADQADKLALKPRSFISATSGTTIAEPKDQTQSWKISNDME
jgi:hypothetical protein